jgi:hypothetical protein
MKYKETKIILNLKFAIDLKRGIINRLFNLLIYCLKECFKIIIKESKYLITV